MNQNQTMDGWVEIARALPSASDPDLTMYWRVSRDLAEWDTRRWSLPGEPMHIQLGRVSEDAYSADDHGYVMTDEKLIDWGAIEMVPGLDAEELRALDVLRDAEIDPGVLAAVLDALQDRAADRGSCGMTPAVESGLTE